MYNYRKTVSAILAGCMAASALMMSAGAVDIQSSANIQGTQTVQGSAHSFSYQNGKLVAIDGMPYFEAQPKESSSKDTTNSAIIALDGIYAPNKWGVDTDSGTNGHYYYSTNYKNDNYQVRTAVASITLKNEHSVTASISGSTDFNFATVAKANMSIAAGTTFTRTESITVNPQVGYNYIFQSWVKMNKTYYKYLKSNLFGSGYTVYTASTTEPYGTDHDISKVKL